MTLHYTDRFRKRLAKRVNKSLDLKEKVERQLGLLQADARHPALKMHKLKGARSEQFAIRIEGDLRITFVRVDDGFLLVDIITHDEY